MSEPQMAQCQSMHTVGFNSANLTTDPSMSRFLSSPCVCLPRSFFRMGKRALGCAIYRIYKNAWFGQGAALVFVMFNVQYVVLSHLWLCRLPPELRQQLFQRRTRCT